MKKFVFFVAANTNTYTKDLEKLAQDEKYTVRLMTAQNTNIPLEYLAKLSIDNNDKVRLSVAHNPSTPENILNELINDKSNLLLRVAAAINLEKRQNCVQ